MILFLLTVAWLAFSDYAVAACTGSSPTWSATADETSIQSCINSASSGDTINVAAGSITISTGLTIASKALKLTGAGVGSTIITDSASNANAIAVTGASATNFVEITGFTWNSSTAHIWGMISVEGTTASSGFRLHHNAVNVTTAASRGINVVGYGLIDNNAFSKNQSVQLISVYGTNQSTDGGYTPWAVALSLGSVNSTYIEDNTFTNNSSDSEDVIDAYSGARLVIRYNTFSNARWGFHGTDSGGNRSPVSFEIYNNALSADIIIAYGGRIRGGTGVIFNNTYSTSGAGSFGDISLVYYRACGNAGSSGWGANGCDGTQYKLMDNALSSDGSRTCNVSGAYGFDSTSLDALPICTHGSGNCTAFFDGGGAGTHGYPCRDQPGRGPGQVLAPVYAWSNTGVTVSAYNLGDTGNCNGQGVEYYIQSGRDYYPSTQHPTYAAYTYPHPLQGTITASTLTGTLSLTGGVTIQ